VDSAQLESGEPLGADFRKDAAREIEAFKQAYRLRNPGADVDKLTDSDLLREAMNTIGKKGKLGENIRCVVSVAMLTEGWDANTVTHILGIRPFRSQLLCEQVVGRGLRRRSYAINEDSGHFEPEYAEIYGVPFAFIPSGPPPPKPKDPRPAIEVRALDERWPLAIRFPKLDGYRVELPDEPLHADFIQGQGKQIAGDIVTVSKVKNVSNGPIAGLRVDEYWYNQKLEQVTGDTHRVRAPIAPGEVVEITTRSPVKPGLYKSTLMFVHANGKVTAKGVKKFTDDAAAKK
jgi:hypothetical protein